MLVKETSLWKGSSWEELQVEFRGNQENQSRDVKVKCPACAEQGKKNLNDPCLSLIPSDGKGHCFKCGTIFIIDKNEPKEKIDSKTKFKAVVPSNTTLLSEHGVGFFRGRRISQAVINKHRIGQKDMMVAFPYFKDGVVVNVKYRGIKEKTFSQTAGGSHLVYNFDGAMKALDEKLTKDVLITEGEIDAMSFEEVGFPAAVSLDSGSPNPADRNISGKFECIDNSFELFDRADIIYLAVDNDINGKISEKELIRRFGAEKVKLVEFGKYKDANEVLLYEGREYLKKLLDTAKEIKIAGIFKMEDCYDEVMEMITNGLTKGTSTYMPSIDKAWKWRVGEVNLWTGYTNEGKSTLLRYLEMLKAKFDGWKFALFVPEDMPLAEFMEGMIHMYCGRPTDPEMKVIATLEQIKEAMVFINDHFYIVYPEAGFTLDTLLEKFKYLIKRHGVRAVDIDPYNQVEHQYGKASREDLYISEFMGKLKRFAVQNSVAVNLVAHQTKPEKKNQDGTYPPPNKYSIKGGGTFADKADNVLVVWRRRRQVDKDDRTTTFISEKIKKPKLVGEIDLNVDITYDYYQNRYLDQTLGMKSPLELQLAFNKTQDHAHYPTIPTV